MSIAAPAPVSYSVSVANIFAHLYRVHLRVQAPAPVQVLSLPVWIPGSYLVREFSRHLQGLQASQANQPVLSTQTSKNTWEIACDVQQPLDVVYEVYAFDNSVRAAWLDDARGFFNPTSLCLMVQGQEGHAHSLHMPQSAFPADWRVATALRAQAVDERGFGYYLADHYDELADSPVEMGNFWQGDFTAAGVAHRFVVAGAGASFDGARLLADVEKICEAEMAFWHADGSQPPHDRYVFMLNVVESGYGGLEHRHSTALICNRDDLPRLHTEKKSDGYTTLLGLISHEYFHTWNVKRMRPAEFTRYDYGQENYTELLWFFEGITSYYDDLLLLRAGLIDRSEYLAILAKTINQVAQTPGRHVQSVAQSSFDAWVKYYRQEENTLNATVSYYTKGALVALCLDLTLRLEGHTTLDDVMRALWAQGDGGPIAERDVLAVLERLSGRSFAPELAAWVHSTQELPLAELLNAAGVPLKHAQAQWPQILGLVVSEAGNTGVSIRRVLRDGLAERAGFAVGDEWLGVRVQGQSWRLKKLEQLSLYVPQGHEQVEAILARDGKIIERSLNLQDANTRQGLVELQLAESALAQPNHWLA